MLLSMGSGVESSNLKCLADKWSNLQFLSMGSVSEFSNPKSGRSFCAVRANAENSCSGAFVRTFARTLPKCSLVGILRCVRDFTFCERRMFLFESVRETVRKNAPEPNKNILAVDILCFAFRQSLLSGNVFELLLHL